MTVKEVKDFLSTLPSGCDDMELGFASDFNIVVKVKKIAPCKVSEIKENPFAYRKSSHPKSKMIILVS